MDCNQCSKPRPSFLYSESQKKKKGKRKCKSCLLGLNTYNRGWTELHNACLEGDLSVVRELVTENIERSDIVDDCNVTPVFVASRCNKPDVVRFLVTQGKASVNIADTDCFTPLFWAAYGGNLDIVRCLVNDGNANVNPIIYDEEHNNFFTPLDAAIDKCKFDVVRFLLTESKVNVDNSMWSTPLMVACSRAAHPVNDADRISAEDRLDMVRLLVLECKANVDLVSSHNSPFTPLTSTIYHGGENLGIVRFLLIEGKASVDLVDTLGWSPLVHAVNVEDLEMVRCLLKANANVSIATKEGTTPLLMAAKKGYRKIVKFIKKHMTKQDIEPRPEDIAQLNDIMKTEIKVKLGLTRCVNCNRWQTIMQKKFQKCGTCRGASYW